MMLTLPLKLLRFERRVPRKFDIILHMFQQLVIFPTSQESSYCGYMKWCKQTFEMSTWSQPKSPHEDTSLGTICQCLGILKLGFLSIQHPIDPFFLGPRMSWRRLDFVRDRISASRLGIACKLSPGLSRD